jgi:hypothetical protein
MFRKNDYIKSIEQRDGIFSFLELSFFKGDPNKYFNSKKNKSVFENTKMNTIGKLITTEVVYETAQKFLIQIELEIPLVTIYYKPEQQKELLFFINQTFKGYKDDTTNN